MLITGTARRGPKHGSKANKRGLPEATICGMLICMWLFGSLVFDFRKEFGVYTMKVQGTVG